MDMGTSTNQKLADDQEAVRPGWLCGAWQPPVEGSASYRCIRQSRHTEDHEAILDGKSLATWPRATGR